MMRTETYTDLEKSILIILLEPGAMNGAEIGVRLKPSKETPSEQAEVCDALMALRKKGTVEFGGSQSIDSQNIPRLREPEGVELAKQFKQERDIRMSNPAAPAPAPRARNHIQRIDPNRPEDVAAAPRVQPPTSAVKLSEAGDLVFNLDNAVPLEPMAAPQAHQLGLGNVALRIPFSRMSLKSRWKTFRRSPIGAQIIAGTICTLFFGIIVTTVGGIIVVEYQRWRESRGQPTTRP